MDIIMQERRILNGNLKTRDDLLAEGFVDATSSIGTYDAIVEVAVPISMFSTTSKTVLFLAYESDSTNLVFKNKKQGTSNMVSLISYRFNNDYKLYTLEFTINTSDSLSGNRVELSRSADNIYNIVTGSNDGDSQLANAGKAAWVERLYSFNYSTNSMNSITESLDDIDNIDENSYIKIIVACDVRAFLSRHVLKPKSGQNYNGLMFKLIHAESCYKVLAAYQYDISNPTFGVVYDYNDSNDISIIRFDCTKSGTYTRNIYGMLKYPARRYIGSSLSGLTYEIFDELILYDTYYTSNPSYIMIYPSYITLPTQGNTITVTVENSSSYSYVGNIYAKCQIHCTSTNHYEIKFFYKDVLKNTVYIYKDTSTGNFYEES